MAVKNVATVSIYIEAGQNPVVENTVKLKGSNKLLEKFMREAHPEALTKALHSNIIVLNSISSTDKKEQKAQIETIGALINYGANLNHEYSGTKIIDFVKDSSHKNTIGAFKSAEKSKKRPKN